MSLNIAFDDGAVYENFMGSWSRLVGVKFLEWLSPGLGKRWLDVGCGNGALSELIASRCSPSEICGLDPSEAQLSFARQRMGQSKAEFRVGSALNLPYEDSDFDLAVMGLVIFFLPDPAKGVAEMVRVVRNGGVVASYAWDTLFGGFTAEPIFEQLRKRGMSMALPPVPSAGNMKEGLEIWAGAGLHEIESQAITVSRQFSDFESYWAITINGPGLGPQFKSMPPELHSEIKETVRASLPPDPDGTVVATARANAIKGVVHK